MLWDLGDYDSAGGHLVLRMTEPGVLLNLLDAHALCGVLFQRNNPCAPLVHRHKAPINEFVACPVEGNALINAESFSSAGCCTDRSAFIIAGWREELILWLP